MDTQILYHIKDGAVEFRSAYVEDALIHKDEWSDKPWPGQAEAPAAPAPAEETAEEPVRRRRGSANNE